jgi:hypothetical protein
MYPSDLGLDTDGPIRTVPCVLVPFAFLRASQQHGVLSFVRSGRQSVRQTTPTHTRDRTFPGTLPGRSGANRVTEGGRCCLRHETPGLAPTQDE